MNRKSSAPQDKQKRGKQAEVVEEDPLPDNGNDTFNSSDGKYEGEWKKIEGTIKRHGLGKFTTEQFTYEGEFSEDLFNGKGVLQYQDGSYYKGEFRNGKICGQGEMLFPNGSRYDGQWYDGRMHGIGTFYTKNNQQWSGYWCHGMSTCPIFPQIIPKLNEEEEEEEEDNEAYQ